MITTATAARKSALAMRGRSPLYPSTAASMRPAEVCATVRASRGADVYGYLIRAVGMEDTLARRAGEHDGSVSRSHALQGASRPVDGRGLRLRLDVPRVLARRAAGG